ncbi:hypothetical protein J6590_066354 [Homalodisca vitripennis]|nr:hypothetical protein J6590_066354 [Homalodisca vitripennis]
MVNSPARLNHDWHRSHFIASHDQPYVAISKPGAPSKGLALRTVRSWPCKSGGGESVPTGVRGKSLTKLNTDGKCRDRPDYLRLPRLVREFSVPLRPCDPPGYNPSPNNLPVGEVRPSPLGRSLRQASLPSETLLPGNGACLRRPQRPPWLVTRSTLGLLGHAPNLPFQVGGPSRLRRPRAGWLPLRTLSRWLPANPQVVQPWLPSGFDTRSQLKLLERQMAGVSATGDIRESLAVMAPVQRLSIP